VQVTGHYDSNSAILTLTASGMTQTSLMQVVGLNSMNIGATSKATMAGQIWQVCAMITDPDSHHTLLVKNQARIDFSNFLVQVNTQNWEAVETRDTSYSVNGRELLGPGHPLSRRDTAEAADLHPTARSLCKLDGAAKLLRPHHQRPHAGRRRAAAGQPGPETWPSRATLFVRCRADERARRLGDGAIDEHARMHGMGIAVEYAGQSGKPEWKDPPQGKWDYRTFAKPEGVSQKPDGIIELTFTTEYHVEDRSDTFAINGKTSRCTLRFGEVTLEFTADQPGLSLFHCHADHMDYGFMGLFECA
jgi:Multicopper oxidase